MFRYAILFITLALIATFLGVVSRYSMLWAEIFFGIFAVIGVAGFLGGSFRLRTSWEEPDEY
jgi:hypothetical protein